MLPSEDPLAYWSSKLTNNGTKTLALVIAAFMTADCAKFVSAGPSVPGASPPAAVEVGDRVRVSMRNGDAKEFKVKAVVPDGLVAEDGTNLPYSEIRQIEKQTTDATRTTLLVVTIVGGTIFFLLAAYASAVASLGG